MSQVHPPQSPQSVGRLLTTELKVAADSLMDQKDFIIYVLRQTGLKCSKCKHSIFVDHVKGICKICGCIRTVTKRKKKGMSVLDLFDVEGSI